MERAVRIAKKLLPFAGAAVFLLAVYAIHRELAWANDSEDDFLSLGTVKENFENE